MVPSMAETRPSGLSVISQDDSAVIQEVAEIDRRRRIHLLPRWTERVDWLRAHRTKNIIALMVLAEPGLASLRDWNVDGPRIENRYEEVARKSDPEALEVLRLIQDRYCRLTITGERRPYLGELALAHLGLPIARGVKSTVFVAVFPDRIDILSPTLRNSKLVLGDASLDDLP